MDAIANAFCPQLTAEGLERVVEFIRTDRSPQIRAIREYRSCTGSGLQHAKEIVEYLEKFDTSDFREELGQAKENYDYVADARATLEGELRFEQRQVSRLEEELATIAKMREHDRQSLAASCKREKLSEERRAKMFNQIERWQELFIKSVEGKL